MRIDYRYRLLKKLRAMNRGYHLVDTGCNHFMNIHTEECRHLGIRNARVSVRLHSLLQDFGFIEEARKLEPEFAYSVVREEVAV